MNNYDIDTITDAIWYAVERDADDNDWSTGSHDYREAVKLAKDNDYKMIAVIAQGNDPICIDEISEF